MAANVSPVNVYAGDTLRLEYHFLSTGDPVDLSGWVFTAQWRRNPTSTTSIDLSVDTTDAATGIIVIRATSEQTTEMGRSGIWDLQGVDGDIIYTFLRGETKWMMDVTHD